MRKMQKILLGVFFGGVLLGGIGTGVALVEYSSLAYGGEKIIGEEGLVTREIDYAFVPEEERVSIVSGYWADGVEADDTVPEGIIRYEITYNENTVEPTVCSWEAGEAEQEAWEDEKEDAENNSTLKMRQICLELQIRYIQSDFALFMECKDEILAELKQKKLFDYQVSYVKEARIKANSKTIPYIRSQSTRYSVYR